MPNWSHNKTSLYFISEDGHMPILYVSMPKIEMQAATDGEKK